MNRKQTGPIPEAIAQLQRQSDRFRSTQPRGKVYHQKEPARLVRFVGHAPLEATVFEMERLGCNACGEVFHRRRTSGPLMQGLHDWMEAQLAEHKTEPNSGLGKAISYLLGRN